MNTHDDSDSAVQVLCVDDEPNVLKALDRVLRCFNCRVLLANNGPEAIKLLQEENIKVLICDEAMPGMCGVEVLRHAKVISPHTARVLLTAHCSDEDVVVAAVNEGEIFRLLAKPWLEDEIKHVVTEALGAEPREWGEQHRRVEERLRDRSSIPVPDTAGR
jgi:response regulator RpfG family c-di-GMP phosphodiesterase